MGIPAQIKYQLFPLPVNVEIAFISNATFVRSFVAMAVGAFLLQQPNDCIIVMASGTPLLQICWRDFITGTALAVLTIVLITGTPLWVTNNNILEVFHLL